MKLMENNTKNNDELINEVYTIVDPKRGTRFEKSRTAFISFSMVNGSITLSAFFARALGITSGDRIVMISSKSNPLKWFVCKTNQRQHSKVVTINRGVYKINSLEWARKIGESFRFNNNFKSLIRLYVNMEDYIVLQNFDNAKALQLFDLPYLREDFETEEEKQNYIKYLEENPYIVKQKRDAAK